jgi:hypothetical protein
MTWKDVNVFQWQQIVNLFTKEKDLTELDLAVKSVAIVKNMTEHQIDSMPIGELNPLLKSIAFIHEEIKPSPVKYIQVGKKRYKCIYDIRKMPAARYIESKYFSQDVNGNLHRIGACMVMPMKKTFFGWKVDKYDASKHEEYAQDLLEAPITAVLGSVVFFCLVYRNWIKASKDYLVSEMMSKSLTKYQAEVLYQTLCETLDGFIKPHWWLSSKESRWSRCTKFLRFNSLMTSLISKRRTNTKQSS